MLCALFLVYKTYETEIESNLLTFYFEDLIALPIILKTALLLIQSISKSWRFYRISLRDLLIITLLFSLYYEGILPILSENFTADWLDLVCYFIGSASFYLILNTPMIQIKTEHENH